MHSLTHPPHNCKCSSTILCAKHYTLVFPSRYKGQSGKKDKLEPIREQWHHILTTKMTVVCNNELVKASVINVFNLTL